MTGSTRNKIDVVLFCALAVLEKGTSVLALEAVFHESYAESGADAVTIIFLEADLFLGCLV